MTQLFLDRFEGDFAILISPDDQELIIPMSLIPSPTEGGIYNFYLEFRAEDTQENRQRMEQVIEDNV